jgi:hypothetical protein
MLSGEPRRRAKHLLVEPKLIARDSTVGRIE